MKTRFICRNLSTAAFFFGLGVLLSCFIPEGVLVVIEALLIAAVGLFYILQK